MTKKKKDCEKGTMLRASTSPLKFMAKRGDLPDVRPASFHLLYNSVTTWKHATVTIDCDYGGIPMAAAAYFLWSRVKDTQDGMAAAFIDNNTMYAIPKFDNEIANKQKNCDVSYDHVKYVIITHVHLDHAGGTGHLLRKCPNATVLCHPRAAKHLIDPAALIKAVKDVYGDRKYREMYGEIVPCPAERVRSVNDGERIDLVPERPLHFHYVTGHANHHFVVHDVATSSVFTGDAFGVHYPWLELYNCRESFFFPSSSPTEFNADQQRQAIDKIVALHPRRAYLTHYGMAEEIEGGAKQLHAALDFYEGLQGRISKLIQKNLDDKAVLAEGESEMRTFFETEMRRRGLAEDDATFWKFFDETDINLNVQGIIVAAKRNIEKGIKEKEPPVIPSPPVAAILEKDRQETSPLKEGPETPLSPTLPVLSKPVALMSVPELQAAFRSLGLDKFSDILKEQDIDGAVFVEMSPQDINEVFTNLTFGGRQKVLRLQKAKSSL